jgi:hypothetical protein
VNLNLPKEIIDKAIEELNKTVAIQSKHYLRLSSQRDVYSIPQASFRLNCSRNEFESLFVDTGKIKLLIRNDKKFVTREEIESYLEHEPKYASLQSTVYNPQLKQNRKIG